MYPNGDKNIILGVDVPRFIKGYEQNERELNRLTYNQSVVAGHIMWELVKSGILKDGLYEFDVIKPEYERDSSFGKIMVKLGMVSDCSNPKAYEEAFNNLLANNKLSDKCRIMVADCYMKMSISMSKGEKLEIVDKTADEVSC